MFLVKKVINSYTDGWQKMVNSKKWNTFCTPQYKID